MWHCDGKEGRAKKPSEGIKEEVIMKNEKWKPIAGYEDYEVSSEGRVRSLNYNKTGKAKVLKPGSNGIGYLCVVLCKDGKTKHFLVHRLVVTAFIGPISPGMQVNHINENKLDNRLENLEIVTHKENQNHGTRNERVAKARSKQLDLMEADWPFRELTFPSSVYASEFFGYQNQSQVGTIISKARQRGENFINIRGERYYFAQAD